MAIIDTVNRLFREFKRYTGDGLPGEPTGAPLPVGDPQSGPYNPKKSELRAGFTDILGALDGATEAAEAAADRAEIAADAAEAAVSSVSVTSFQSVAAASAYSPTIAPAFLRTEGFATPGDQGGAIYKAVVSEPAHAGKFSITLDDGITVVWYELAVSEAAPQMFGFVGNGTNVDTLKFQAAIDSGFALVVPPGVFNLTLAQTMQMEGGAVKVALRLRPGKAKLRAAVRGATTLRMANSQSTDASPQYFNMIGVNEAITGLDIQGIIFDLNGQNNKISPNRHRNATVTISNANPAVVAWTAHGLSVNNRVIFNTTGTLPAGLDPKRRYYVKTVINANSFTVSLTPGGAAVATTTAGSGTHTATGGSYNQFNCAALMVSGSVATAGADARLINSRILYNEFLNSPGVTCIALGQSNTNSGGGGTGAILGNNIEIAYNRFYNNGLDADDHSSVYMWANNVRVHHNLFDHPTMSSGFEGPYAAFELHGSHNWFESNTVNNYQWGGYIAGNWTEVSRGQFIVDNDFFTAKKGVIAFVNLPTEPGMQDVQIRGNRFWLSADFQGEYGFDGSTVKKAIDLRPEYGAMRDVIIANNVIKTFDNYGAFAIDIGCYAASNGLTNVKVNDNLISGFPVSITVGRTGGGSVLDADISGNQIVDVRFSTLFPGEVVGIRTEGANGRLRIRDNSFSRESGLVNYGLFLQGTATHLDADGNAGAVVEVTNNVTVQGYRTGRQACTFSALPSQGTWKLSDYVPLAAPALLGVSPNKYIVFGWQRLTAGTGNLLGTDWAEDRSGSTGL